MEFDFLSNLDPVIRFGQINFFFIGLSIDDYVTEWLSGLLPVGMDAQTERDLHFPWWLKNCCHKQGQSSHISLYDNIHTPKFISNQKVKSVDKKKY